MRRILGFSSTSGPLARALAVVVTVVLLGVAVVMGTVLAVLLLGLAAVGALAFVGRVWWLRRRMRRAPPPFADRPAGGRPPIDAEFRVVEPEESRPAVRPRDADG